MLKYLLLIELVIGMLVGHQSVSFSYPISDGLFNLLVNIRLPRLLGAAIIGAGLATAGAAYQSAFKNPIVSPSILGVSSGAGIGAAICMLLGIPHMISTFAVIFGCGTVWIVWNIAKAVSRSTAYILVIGVIISGVSSSALSLIKFVGDPDGVLPAITFWLMGSLSSLRLSMWPYLSVILVVTVLFFWGRWRLDILYQPSDVVRSLGINEKRNIAVVVFGATVIAAFSSAIAGVIGMVGLAIPHLVRMVMKTDDNVKVMGNIQLAGAMFLVGVDTVIRMLPLELPIGILTSLVGALIFGVALAVRLKRKGGVQEDE